MTTVRIEIPDKLVPVFEGEADVRGAHGGRGSAKSRTFAKMAAIRAHMWDAEARTGLILCARQFQNSLDDSSLEEVKAAIRETEWLAPHFDIGERYIRTASGRITFTFSGLDRNIDSIKGKSRILLAWVEEAEAVTEEAWVKLIPTLREEDSELWVTWNPEDETSATNQRFHTEIAPHDPRTKIVEINYRDNPWFPQSLERKRQKDERERPHLYAHIWDGAFLEAVEGAYYAPWLNKAQDEGRIAFVPEDPHHIIYLCADIGGTGAKADNFVFWARQDIGLEIRWTNYYEAQGQPIGTHLAWMRSQGYTPDRVKIVLPHDGATMDKVIDVSYEKGFREAGYEVTVVPNQGKGAAKMRIERARQLFGKMRFDEVKTAPGRKSLGRYHPKFKKNTKVDLGPEHDEDSHAADAFGGGCVQYREPTLDVPRRQRPRARGAGGWMMGS